MEQKNEFEVKRTKNIGNITNTLLILAVYGFSDKVLFLSSFLEFRLSLTIFVYSGALTYHWHFENEPNNIADFLSSTS